MTLDALAAEHGLVPPFLLKLDVDGKEIEVLEGASGVLREADCIVIEAGLWALTTRATYLERLGFHLWDVVDLGYNGNVLYQVDLVFLHQRLRGLPEFRPWLDKKVLVRPLHGHR